MSDLVTIEELKATGQWGTRYISAIGLIPHIQKLGENIVGLEVGACRGENGSKFLEECPNIVHLDLIDPYTAYSDVNGTSSQETLDKSKEISHKNLAAFGDRARIHVTTSQEFAKQISEKTYDYIFIDGNHSYPFVKDDLFAFYPKMKSGGIFAGHDYHLPDVQRALKEFRDICMITTPIQFCDNFVWFWHKG
jgi:hypothetical protein